MTLVGDNNLRQDIHQSVRDKIPSTNDTGLQEVAEPLRARDVLEPFDRSRTNEVVTYPEFKEIFRKAVAFAEEAENRSYSINVIEGFCPPEDAQLPCLTFQRLKSMPYEGGTGVKERAFRQMESLDDPDYPGNIILREFRRVENLVEIKIWAKDEKECERLADWLEDMFYEYLWVFQWCGLAHPMTWETTGAEEKETVRNQVFRAIPLTFRVITGKIIYKRVTRLRKFSIRVGILRDYNSDGTERTLT